LTLIFVIAVSELELPSDSSSINPKLTLLLGTGDFGLLQYDKDIELVEGLAKAVVEVATVSEEV